MIKQDDDAGRVQPHGLHVLAQGLPRQQQRRHRRAGSQDRRDHADHRHRTSSDFRTFTQDVYPMWGADGKIYFASERDGTFNIWRIAPTGGAPQQVTRAQGRRRAVPVDLARTARRIIYENEFELWTLDVPSGTAAQGHRSPWRSIRRTNIGQFLTTQQPRRRLRAFAERRLPRGRLSTARSSSCRPMRTSARRCRSRARRGASASSSIRRTARWLAYISDESGEEEVWVCDWRRGTRKKLTHARVVQAELQLVAGLGEARVHARQTGCSKWTSRAAKHDRARATTRPAASPVSEYSPTASGWSTRSAMTDQNAEVYPVRRARRRRENNVTQNPFRDSGGC